MTHITDLHKYPGRKQWEGSTDREITLPRGCPIFLVPVGEHFELRCVLPLNQRNKKVDLKAFAPPKVEP